MHPCDSCGRPTQWRKEDDGKWVCEYCNCGPDIADLIGRMHLRIVDLENIAVSQGHDLKHRNI